MTLRSRGLAFRLPGTSTNIIPWVASYRKKGRHKIATIHNMDKKENTAVLYRRVGSTTYKVRVHFSDTAQDTIHDKILHLVQNGAVTNGDDCGIMTIPQTSQPFEGSSL